MLNVFIIIMVIIIDDLIRFFLSKWGFVDELENLVYCGFAFFSGMDVNI